MIHEKATNVELANDIASSNPESSDMLQTTYKKLNAEAHCKSNLVTISCKSLSSAWNEILPILAEMQSFLSQRGEKRDALRKAELPSWIDWFRSFKEETGLDATLRTVQYRLKQSRQRGTRKCNEPAPLVRLTAKDQRRLVKINQCANEMVKAIETGADHTDIVREYKRLAIASENVGRLLDTLPPDATAGEESPVATLVAVTTELAATDSPAPKEPKSIPTLLSSRPRAGDWSGLVDNVSAMCGEDFRAALDGLEPEMLADVFGKFAIRLAKMYCHRDYNTAEIQVVVKAVMFAPTMIAKVDQMAII